jgi:hypothetical protein
MTGRSGRGRGGNAGRGGGNQNNSGGGKKRSGASRAQPTKVGLNKESKSTSLISASDHQQICCKLLKSKLHSTSEVCMEEISWVS